MGKDINTVIGNLGFPVRKIYLSSRIKTTFQGETFLLDISRRDFLRLSLPVRTSLGFTVTRSDREESGLEPGFLDLRKQVKTFDTDFDKKFLLMSDREDEVRRLFNFREFKDAIRALFNGWVAKLELDGEYLIVNIFSSANQSTTRLRNIPEMMLALKKLLVERGFLLTAEDRATSNYYWISYVIPVIMAFIQIIFAVLFPFWMRKDFDPLVSGQLIFKTLLIYVPLIAAYLFFAFRITRNHPSFVKKFSVCIILAIVWLFSAFPFVQGVNGYFDRSAAVKSDFVVIDKMPKARKSQTYILILKERGSEGEISDKLTGKFFRMVSPREMRIAVKREEYLKVKPHETSVVLYIRDGALGIRWVDEYVLSEDGKITKD